MISKPTGAIYLAGFACLLAIAGVLATATVNANTDARYEQLADVMFGLALLMLGASAISAYLRLGDIIEYVRNMKE